MTTENKITPLQAKSVLSRFTNHSSYGQWDPAHQTYHNQYSEFHCKLCPQAKHTVQLPFSSQRHKTITPSTWFRRFENTYRVYIRSNDDHEDNARIAELHNHLVTAHDIVPCKVCGLPITKRGMTRHQNAPACQSELRRHHMRQEGFDLLSAYLVERFESIIDKKKTLFEKSLDWRDYEAHLMVERAAEDAVRSIVVDLGIRPAFTFYDPKQKEYLKEYWANQITAYFLQLADEVTSRGPGGGALAGPGSEELIDLSNQWVAAGDNDDMRDAILGILELKKDSAV